MQNLIKNITRPIDVLPPFIDGEHYEIILNPTTNLPNKQTNTTLNNSYNFKVKNYMTKKATDSFDFMKKWNNDIPLPSTEISGKVTKETKGMIYVENNLGSWWIIKSAILSQELLN